MKALAERTDALKSVPQSMYGGDLLSKNEGDYVVVAVVVQAQYVLMM